ncbi:MAG: bifunctional folylpolyglutamate synthase/dihydrofolate synthase [Atopobiaceae bacterium]|nr:bifunctional folylpolyglutamate synthase/dihydrofolate synthase [Atopobiaceae bacterium]
MGVYAIPFDVPALSYDESLAMLHSALRFGIVPLLETVQDMLAELRNPDQYYRSVQIAGTNGKTSTSRYVAALLAGEGLTVALYTSPELVHYTERMEIGGRPVDEDFFALGLSAANTAAQRVNARRLAAGDRPYDVTEFDMLTVAACVAFALCGVDVAVFEVGLGGRWDATSAVTSIESVAITGIGLDHTRILGNTLEEIAAEKAAVVRQDRTCVLGCGTSVTDGVREVIAQRCKEQGVAPWVVREADAEHAEAADARASTIPHVVRESDAERAEAAVDVEIAVPQVVRGAVDDGGQGLAPRVVRENDAEATTPEHILKNRLQVGPWTADVPGFEVPSNENVTFGIANRPSHLGDALELWVRTPNQTYTGIRALKPTYQAQNIACAIAVAEQFVGHSLELAAARASIASCPTPGRFDVVREKPLALVDACHNPQSVEVFLRALDDVEPDVRKRPTLVCAMLADKDTQGMAKLLSAAFPRVVVTQTESPRALAAADLAELFAACGCEVRAVCETVAEAVALFEHEPFVACGSITTAGAVVGLLRQWASERMGE